jgi:hypothetical protein
MSGKIPDRNAAVVRIWALFPDNPIKAVLLGAAATALPDELFQVREAYCSSFGRCAKTLCFGPFANDVVCVWWHSAWDLPGTCTSATMSRLKRRLRSWRHSFRRVRSILLSGLYFLLQRSSACIRFQKTEMCERSRPRVGLIRVYRTY